ncbi:MAG: SDR family NAD(P)-dependent oxidoreductase, partial [Polyangiales bacterium]
MTEPLRFDGKVVLITGAGAGLGRSHALLFASRGAKVVVNDLGGSHTGGGKSSAAADAVVAEIKANGGEAVANYDSVEEGTSIIKTALDAFGRIDVVVNNAGILRDTSFQKMTDQDWDLIYRVHVLGAYKVTKAAWDHLREQGYGRVIFTSSAAGIYGNFGQANYSLAKLGLVGLTQTLALEGRKKNVHVNAIAPIAGSRMTETVLPKDLLDSLKPEYVSALVAYLCHESTQETGGLFEVGGGFYGKLRWERAEGKTFRVGRAVTPEAVAEAFPKIVDFSKTTHPADVTASMGPILANVQAGPSKGGNEFIDVDEALGFEFPEQRSSYDEKDLALYALGVGAGRNPLDSKDLRYIYELHGDGFQPLPTFAVVPALNTIMAMAKSGTTAPGMHYGFDRILHGEQYTELLKPLPTHAKLRHKAKITNIFDKG